MKSIIQYINERLKISKDIEIKKDYVVFPYGIDWVKINQIPDIEKLYHGGQGYEVFIIHNNKLQDIIKKLKEKKSKIWQLSNMSFNDFQDFYENDNDITTIDELIDILNKRLGKSII